ncbi:hypothetical protein P2318_32845 [Myxococcaceae bacterium GXIMD 01537]
MRRALLLLPLLPLAAGCDLYPEDPLFAYGRVLNADGSPAAHQTVAFDRGLNPHTLSSSGQVVPEPSFAPFTQATTLADGTYTLELTYGDTYEETFEMPRTYRFRTATAPDSQGQAVVGSFRIYSGDVEMPTLRPWEAGLTLSASAAGPTLSFSQPPGPPEAPPSAQLMLDFSDPDNPGEPRDLSVPVPVLQLHGADGLMWQVKDATSPWAPNAWMLEDFAAEAQVRAISVGSWYFEPLGGNNSSCEFRLEWRTGRKPLPPGTLRPLSRGAACLQPTEGECPLTDGKLAPVVLTPAVDVTPLDIDTPPPLPVPVMEAGVTLSAPARLSRAVIRGLVPSATYPTVSRMLLEGSEDGATWRTLADVALRQPGLFDEVFFVLPRKAWPRDNPYDAPLVIDSGPLFLDMPVTDPAPLKHVRIHLLNPEGNLVSLNSLAEVSLFE